MVLPDGFVDGTEQQARVQGYRNAMRGTRPTQFVNGASGEHECGPGLGGIVNALSRGDDFVPDGPAQHDVQEIMHVFVLRNHTRGNAIILDRKTSPSNRRAAQRRSRMQERLDATLPEDFDSGNNGPINGCHERHIDASKPSETGAGWDRRCSSTADFERISEDLHSFGVLELRAPRSEHKLIERTREHSALTCQVTQGDSRATYCR
jgi:hypothetical protein